LSPHFSGVFSFFPFPLRGAGVIVFVICMCCVSMLRSLKLGGGFFCCVFEFVALSLAAAGDLVSFVFGGDIWLTLFGRFFF